MLLSFVILVSICSSFAFRDKDDDPNRMICFEKLKDDLIAYKKQHPNDYVDVKVDYEKKSKPCQSNKCQAYTIKDGHDYVFKTIHTFEADYSYCGKDKVCLQGKCKEGRPFCETMMKKDVDEAKKQGKMTAVRETKKLSKAEGPPDVCKTMCQIVVDGKDGRAENFTSAEYQNCMPRDGVEIDNYPSFPYYCKNGACVSPDGDKAEF